MTLRIFIGWDSRFPEPADVLKYSLLKHSSVPLDIQYLELPKLGLNRQHDPLASTEFTYSRFLVPHLCGFQGTALFLDNDMLCFSDMRELAELDMQPYALRVVKHEYQPQNTVKMYGAVQTSYPRKNWSSMMLMNCARLTLWSKQAVETQSGAYLHRFQDIPDEQIGELPKTWNTLDWMDVKTKLIHYTNGGPWFEQYQNHPHAGIWYRYRDEMKGMVKRANPFPHLELPRHPFAPAPAGSLFSR
ncbi:MAG TPA: glycosyltransferase [Pirellulales bacterium]|jgi:lipopolysaccharide biosynthesis glycosyltransferase|nr:glycosyltransferase [Pirellulales bacterium]